MPGYKDYIDIYGSHVKFLIFGKSWWRECKGNPQNPPLLCIKHDYQDKKVKVSNMLVVLGVKDGQTN